MKKILAFAAMFAAMMALAETPVGNGQPVKPSIPQTNAVARAHRMLEKTGGSIMRPLPEGSKALLFLDARADNSDNAFLKKTISRIEAMTGLYVKTVTGALESYDNKAGDVIVALVDKGDLALYPDKMIAIVPAGKDLDATGKVLWQATIALFSLFGKKVNDLHGSGIVRSAAEAYGIPQARRAFYAKALQEGWAPPPANEYQKALWDKFQAEKAAKDAEKAPEAK